ncbi:MAG: hypothetical protein EA407_02395 [Rhodobacteraceae bacterium]|nr:MAG: hypothetical protein EA407_02395 [Paracoccaceae bacterium]
MRLRLFILVLLYASLLASCDSPSPSMQGAMRHEAVLESYRFTIWQKGDQVEIIRHGYAPSADQPKLRGLMVQAAQQTTGCRLQPGSAEGDTGVLRARLGCE